MPVYNLSTVWVCPSGVDAVNLILYGAGAGGISGGGLAIASGGGGGAYTYAQNISVIPGSSYIVNVGSGGRQNQDGGDTWFGSTTTALAKGGKSAGAGASGGLAAFGVGTTKFSGGNGQRLSSPGGGGSSAGSGSNGNDGSSPQGGLAPAGGFAGGSGKNGVNGLPGFSPGGGGGGSIGATAGQGGDGQITLSTTLTINCNEDLVFEQAPSTLSTVKGLTTGKSIVLEANSPTLNYITSVSAEPTFKFENGAISLLIPLRSTTTMPLFLKAEDGSAISGSLPLSTYSATNSGLQGNLPLYAEAAYGNAPTGIMPLFTLGPNSVYLSGIMPLYTFSSNERADGSLPLFLCNELIFSGIPLYTQGGVSDGSYSMAGASIGSGEMALFINRPTSNVLSLYLKGPGTLDSGVLALYTLGSIYMSGSLPMAVTRTYGQESRTITLYANGY